jgi:hypothetical protein
MPQKPSDRNYRKEYDNYHAKPKQRKRRSKRNQARRKMEKAGKVSKGDGKEVDHRTPISKGGSNHASNLQVMSRSKNRKKYDGGSRKRSNRTKRSVSKGSSPAHSRRIAERQTARNQPRTSEIRSGGVKGPKRTMGTPSKSAGPKHVTMGLNGFIQ